MTAALAKPGAFLEGTVLVVGDRCKAVSLRDGAIHMLYLRFVLTPPIDNVGFPAHVVINCLIKPLKC